MVAQIDGLYWRSRPLKAAARLVAYGLFEGRPLTTRGRWINPLVFLLQRTAVLLPQARQVRDPLFIVGTGRSGTTVLGKVLSMHRDVGYLNEPKAMWHGGVGNEDILGNYDDGDARYRLGAEDATPDAARKMQRMAGLYLWLTGATRLLDKYPELVFRVPFVRQVFPGARFILLVRNGWDTAGSIGQWSGRRGVRRGRKRDDWWGRNDRKWLLLVDQVASVDPELKACAGEMRGIESHPVRAAVEWVLAMKEGLAMARAYPADVLTLKYEDLTCRGEEKLAELCRFAGLSEDRVFLEYAAATLRQPREHGRFDLPDYLTGPFRNVMRALGYHDAPNEPS